MCSNSAAPIARPSQMGVTGPQHLLLSHLNQVAEKAVIFAKSWEGDRHTHVAALWHDLGKYNPEVQKYLNGVGPQVNHAIVGALHADRQANAGNRLACLSVAFAIAGHHAGLADYTTASDTPQGTYKYRMKDLVSHALYGASVASPHVPVELLQEKVPPLPQWVEKDRLSPSDKRNFSFAFFTRMTFSVLVDADRLQTECDVDEATAALRGSRTTFGALRANFDAFFAEKIDTKADSPINRLRQQVRTQCRAAAKRDDMLFTLSAATGLGKTLSGLAFALDRVAIFADDDKPFTRVIYVAPFTSIIDQTAGVFRAALADPGTDAKDCEGVLEHHSAIREEAPRGNPEVIERRMRDALGRENWDVPVIVTTAVQFFESLFAAHPRRARKIHRIANSVVFIDEAQFLPPKYLKPLTRALRELIERYNVTVVLATATQPDLSEKDWAGFKGLPYPYEIIADVPGLFAETSKRVQIKLPASLHTPISWDDVADKVVSEPQTLTIVNTKAGARTLHAMVAESVDHAYHLSANMCAEHRSVVLDKVRALLPTPAEREAGAPLRPVRLISTSLIEAGVDIDFPRVLRAMSGLDSLAQAAGRANREGFLPFGLFEVIITDENTHHIRAQILAATAAIRNADPGSHLFSPENFHAYFEHWYGFREVDGDVPAQNDPLDARGLFDLLHPPDVRFREAEAAMRLIDQDTVTVVVPYTAKGAAVCDGLRQVEATGVENKSLFKRAQRFSVSILRKNIDKMLALDTVDVLQSIGVCVANDYDLVYGLVLPDEFDI